MREDEVQHRCACILVWSDEDAGGGFEDHCPESAGPDEPFCVNCEEQQHHLLPQQKPMSERRVQ